ncbi:hypothetical protein HYC85_022754 [Camellia sinensis]|uniref:Rab-GAP TBC domain-containing protein n=1 Tax=Camellia sinensis TaxID=4442 RepID=A0A7J7GDU5_CAMSI|nr:hypothetical protein HYC85_022754 [Camellia sinensis]
MLTQQKPLMRALRRSHTSLPLSSASNSSSPSSSSSSSSSSWIYLRSVLLVVAPSSSPVSTDRGSLKSPWSHRRRKHALLPKQWKSLFNSDGRLCDGGVKFLKKVRSGAFVLYEMHLMQSIRRSRERVNRLCCNKKIWAVEFEHSFELFRGRTPLRSYDMNSSKEERDSIKTQKRKEYDNLRRRCQQMAKPSDKSFKLNETSGNQCGENSGDLGQVLDSPGLEEVGSPTGSISAEGGGDPDLPVSDVPFKSPDTLSEEGGDESGITCENASEADSESSDSDSSEETDNIQPFIASEGAEENKLDDDAEEKSTSSESQGASKSHAAEDFSSWRRIIRLDAVRANAEWVIYSPSQADVSETKARELAESVGLKDFDHLEPCRIFHAARLVAILEAYALYDSEIGYCQGMSDLLSPIISVMEEDHEAFWCFVGFMRKARHNFRLDEVGIRRQLNIVSKVIKCKDSHLYKHLEKLQAEDCFFVYRMVVVLFRRELNFEQTLCLWEVMWADQAAIRAGIAKSASGRMKLRAPPSDDLLLYAIAACVLQRRKLIIEKYNSMDEIIRECNSMAGHLDVWKLLDDAHDLVVMLHDKI